MTKNFLKFMIAFILGIVVIGSQSCGTKSKSESEKDSVTVTVGAMVDENGNIVILDEESESNWKVENMKDEFGDENGNKFLSALFSGTFSDGASTGAEVVLQVIYSENVPVFRIFNYGDKLVQGENFFRFKIKDTSDNINVVYLSNNSGFLVPQEVPGTLGMQGLDSLLRTERTLKLAGVKFKGTAETGALLTELGYLDSPDYGSKAEAGQPKYNFVIEPKGLSEAVKKLK